MWRIVCHKRMVWSCTVHGTNKKQAEFDRKIPLGRVRFVEVVLLWCSKKEVEVLQSDICMHWFLLQICTFYNILFFKHEI
jgi:hypothetical protein